MLFSLARSINQPIFVQSSRIGAFVIFIFIFITIVKTLPRTIFLLVNVVLHTAVTLLYYSSLIYFVKPRKVPRSTVYGFSQFIRYGNQQYRYFSKYLFLNIYNLFAFQKRILHLRIENLFPKKKKKIKIIGNSQENFLLKFYYYFRICVL